MSGTNRELTQTRPFGRLLKFWRVVHGLSQERLAFRIDSAARHISRLERGGAHPSKEMVENIASALGLGQRDSNHMLIFAGYNPDSINIDIQSPAFAVLKHKVLRGLRAMDPYPSILIDMLGNFLMVNKGWVGLQKLLVPGKPLGDPLNFYEMFINFAERKLLPADWEDDLVLILLTLQQAVLLGEDPNLKTMLERLLKSPGVPENWEQVAAKREPGGYLGINVPMHGEIHRFFTYGMRVNLFGVLTFSAIPEMIQLSFYPEQEELDISSLINDVPPHPLLFY
jgi:transcriptional regulator with XRE-family HTH domain